MTRTYTLKRRAEQQAETRRRIVEAAVELHSTLGPARTTFSMVADRAGVQRHTLYSHFPDEKSLLTACSGLVAEQRPLPEAAPWKAIVDRRERLKTGLTAVYGWFERNASLAGCVLRDAETHPPVAEIAALRFIPFFAAYNEVLGAKLNAKQRAMLNLALHFSTWRSLVAESGLKTSAAVNAMIDAIEGAGKT